MGTSLNRGGGNTKHVFLCCFFPGQTHVVISRIFSGGITL